MADFDPKRPVESFKALVLDLMKGYRFDVEGLYLKDGTVRPLPSGHEVVERLPAMLADWVSQIEARESK